MSEDTNTAPSFLARLAGLILRLLFVFILGIALGVGIFYGARGAYRQFIQPVQEHTLRLAELEAHQDENQSFAVQRFEDITGRLDALEIQNDDNKQALADLEDRLDSIESTQAAQVEDLDAMAVDLESIQTKVDDLQSTQASLQDDVESLQTASSALGELRADVEAAAGALDENSQTLDELGAALQSVGDGWQGMLNEFQMLKAMELLTRSRLNLVQGNLSLARADIESGRDLLVSLQELVSTDQAVYLEEVVARLDAALEDLPRSSIAAADEVEGAWQLLLEGLPPVEEQPTETP